MLATYVRIYPIILLGSCEGELGWAQNVQVRSFLQKAREMCQSISTEHKDIHASISKFGKAI